MDVARIISKTVNSQWRHYGSYMRALLFSSVHANETCRIQVMYITWKEGCTQALYGLAPKCKLINMHELINKSTNDYVTLLPCENGANVNKKG